MPSIADNLLSAGAAAAVEAVHGEQVVVLTGLDSGKTFVAVREIESDVTVSFDNNSPDPRARRMLRFRVAPRLNPNDRIRTDDGKLWNAVRSPQDGYLTTDFELTEITAKDA
jgi:hypothetical protein